MKRFRDLILGIFQRIVIEGDGYRDLDESETGRGKGTRWVRVSRRTRVHCTETMTDEIPSTGGLRVITGDTIVLVDADRSGGITRLLHCWEFLTRQEGVNPTHISLFYVLVSPPNNSKEYYRSRWEFAKGRAQKECKMRLQAFLASCERPARLEPRAGLSPAIVQQTTAELRNQGMLSAFEAALAGNLGQYLGTGPVTNLETTRHEETRARIEQRSL